MFRALLVFALLLTLSSSVYADCASGRCTRPALAAQPVRSVVRGAGVASARVARAAVVIPVRAAKRAAAWVERNRPVRRAVRATARGAARVATAPVRAVRHARCHRGQCR